MNQQSFNPESQREHPHASRIRSVLRALMGATGGSVNAAAAITSDGMVIASVLQPGVDPDRFAAMSASLLALAEREIDEIQRGDLRQLLIEGTKGAVLLVQAGDDAVLAVSAEPGALMGKVFLEARRAAGEMKTCLEPT